jgi:hypothetical protein
MRVASPWALSIGGGTKPSSMPTSSQAQRVPRSMNWRRPRRTIEELEAELEAVKAASAVQRGGAGQPKRRCQVAEALSNLGPPRCF